VRPRAQQKRDRVGNAVVAHCPVAYGAGINLQLAREPALTEAQPLEGGTELASGQASTLGQGTPRMMEA